VIALGELRALLSGAENPGATTAVVAGATAQRADAPPEPTQREEPFMALLAERQDQFDRAREGRDVEGMVAAILSVETAMAEWSSETFSGDERERGRSQLRRMVTRLGEAATEGTADPRERVAPLVEAILALRRQFREERRFDDADRLRDLLTGCSIEVRDGRQGEESGWELAARG
jgi:cysteinyl-tRNA synthetase